MDIFQRLREDHDKHRTLLDLLAKTAGASDGRSELFDKLKHEVRAHADAEERSFYSRLMQDGSSQPKTRHSVKEHAEANELLCELEDMSFENPNWIRKFKKLKEELEHHMNEEEHGVFQLAGRVLSDTDKSAAASRFEREKSAEL